jgi:hypothetical protein
MAREKAKALEIYEVKGSKPPLFFHKETPLLKTSRSTFEIAGQ